MSVKKHKPNDDTLVTFGEEAYTMRKDDPRTKKAIERSKELQDDKIKEWIQSGEVSMFEGLNMNNARGEDEDFQDYKARQKTNKNLEKIYRKLGSEECKKQFPMGFKYAIIQSIENTNKKDEAKLGALKKGQELTAIVKDKDGNVLDIPVEINNKK
jgi:hypothetical protein|tara:strand:- start:68 stop:535 length:468 start_codon:yes stop_codon:yes gene_type:complete